MEPTKNHFHGCINPDQVRTRYLELVQSGADLVEVNKQLADRLASMDGKKFTAQSKKGSYTFTFKLDDKTEQRFREAIEGIVALRMPDVSISLLGSWLWIEGDNTREFKDQLKAFGCRFNGKRTRETGQGTWNWTLTKPQYRRRYNSKLSRNDLGEKYQEQRVA